MSNESESFDTTKPPSPVVQRIREHIVETFLLEDVFDLGNDDSFLDEGIIDSTGMLELVAWIQDDFGIKIQDAELIPENLDSVNNVAALIARKQA